MSVINKMLQDLEKRQQPSSTSKEESSHQGFVRPELQFVSETNKPVANKTPIRVFSWIIVVIAAASIWLGYDLYLQANKASKPLLVEANPKQSAQPQIQVNSAAESQKESEIKAEKEAEKEAEDDVLTTATQVASSKAPEDSIKEPRQADPEVSSDSLLATIKSEAITPKKDIQEVPEKSLVSSVDTMSSENEVKTTKVSSLSANAQSASPTNIAATKPASIKETQPNKQVANAASKKSASANKMTVTEVTLSKAQLAQIQFDKAQEAKAANQLDKAGNLYLEALILQPEMHKARKELVSIYFSQNNSRTAIRLLESGISQFPKYWEYYLIKANFERTLQDYQQALTTIEAIDSSSDWAKDKFNFKAEVAKEQGNHQQAEQAYFELTKLEPSQAMWWLGLGYAQDSQQAYRQAVASYNQALTQPGLSSSAISFVEQRLQQLNDYRN